jgi:hypothetical protein
MRASDALLLLLASFVKLAAATSTETSHRCSVCISAGGIWYTGDIRALNSNFFHDSQVTPSFSYRGMAAENYFNPAFDTPPPPLRMRAANVFPRCSQTVSSLCTNIKSPNAEMKETLALLHKMSTTTLPVRQSAPPTLARRPAQAALPSPAACSRRKSTTTPGGRLWDFVRLKLIRRTRIGHQHPVIRVERRMGRQRISGFQ